LSDRDAEARVLHAGGRLIRGQQGSRAAAERLRQALDLLPADGDQLLRAQIYSGLGHTLQSLDPFGEALPMLQEATRLARDLDDERLLAQSLAYTGMLYGNQLDFEASRRSYEEALTIFRKLGPSGLMADVLSGLASSHVGLGRAEDAIEAATAAYDLAVELRNAFSVPFALADLGRAYQLRGDLERAVSTHRRAVEAGKASGLFAAEWATQLDLADSLLAVGEADEALGYVDGVLRAATDDKDNMFMMKAWEGLADHATATGNSDAAAGHLQQALAIAEEFLPPHSTRLREKLAELEPAAPE
jgi:tetratricopeptide (TPR) repeat protein